MGTSKGLPLSEGVSAFYSQLLTHAKKLNETSDKLGEAVGAVDESLKQLNLGISAWVKFYEDDYPDGSYAYRALGYDKVNGKWGLAIKRAWGHEADDNSHGEDRWLFNDAPRDLRIESITQVPALFAELLRTTFETIDLLEQTVNQALQFAEAINSVARNTTPRAKR